MTARAASFISPGCLIKSGCALPGLSEPTFMPMVNQTPDDFRFGLKVTDAITIKKFPKLDQFGDQAAKPNESFLIADLFVPKHRHPFPSRGAITIGAATQFNFAVEKPD
jgi:hypothetical protein